MDDIRITSADLPVVVEQLTAIAEIELCGLDWEEPLLTAAAEKIRAARDLLVQATEDINQVRDGLA